MMKKTPMTFTRALGLVALCSTLVLVGCGGGGNGNGKSKTTAPTAVVNHGQPDTLIEDGLGGTGSDSDPTLLADVNGPDFNPNEISNAMPVSTATPEPGTAALALLGGLGLLTVVTRRKRPAGA